MNAGQQYHRNVPRVTLMSLFVTIIIIENTKIRNLKNYKISPAILQKNAKKPHNDPLNHATCILNHGIIVLIETE